MATTTYTCTSGTYNANTSWTSIGNIYDGNTSTYATGTTYNNTDYLNYRVYNYTTVTGTGDITKVEFGVKGKKEEYYYGIFAYLTTSGGWYEDNYISEIPLTTSVDTYWFDVTSGTGTVLPWNNSDINYANLGIYTRRTNPFSDLSGNTQYCYIYETYWRITTT